MEHGCCKGGEQKCCWVTETAKLLIVIGGLNWGLIAINPEWNVVIMLLGQWPVAVQVVYGLVGVAALMTLGKLVMKCCGGCKACTCGTKK